MSFKCPTRLLALIVALAPDAASAAIAYVQGNYSAIEDTVTTVTVTYTEAQTAGSLNVVVVGWNDDADHDISVTDTKGHTYTLAVGPTRLLDKGQSIYYAKNITASAANANTVSVTFDAAVTYPDIRIVEYSGIDTANPLDAVAANTGTSLTTDSGSLTTTNANDLLFASNTVNQFITGPGANYTQRILNPFGDIVEDRVVTSTGSYNAAAPLNATGYYVMQLVAFKAAGAINGVDCD